MRSQLDELNQRDQALDRAGVTDFLQARLEGVPVLMLKVDGVDDGPTTALRQTILAAGADYAGTVTVTDRLGLGTSADVSAAVWAVPFWTLARSPGCPPSSGIFGRGSSLPRHSCVPNIPNLRPGRCRSFTAVACWILCDADRMRAEP